MHMKIAWVISRFTMRKVKLSILMLDANTIAQFISLRQKYSFLPTTALFIKVELKKQVCLKRITSGRSTDLLIYWLLIDRLLLTDHTPFMTTRAPTVLKTNMSWKKCFVSLYCSAKKNIRRIGSYSNSYCGGLVYKYMQIYAKQWNQHLYSPSGIISKCKYQPMSLQCKLLASQSD